MRATLVSVLTVALALSVNARAAERVMPADAAVRESEAREPRWRFGATAYLYVVPEHADYLLPIVRAGREWLHLEARYSYEDLLTGSAWVGAKAAGGESVWWELVPMVGTVFGRTNGVAPGYEAAVGWWKLELYSEGEYLFDFDPAADDFFFNWSELTLAPVPWFRFGILTERTRVFSSGRVLERGLLTGFTWEPATLTLYLLNPDDARPTFIVALGAGFDS
jgi:hypothetical protein